MPSQPSSGRNAAWRSLTPAIVCLFASAGCSSESSRNTSLTLALAPSASCAESAQVDIVTELRVRLERPGEAPIDFDPIPFDVAEGAEASLGNVPRKGHGVFSVEGIGELCPGDPVSIFDGTSTDVEFDPRHDQRVVVPVTCSALTPACPTPTTTPTGPVFATFQAAVQLLGEPDYLTCNGGGLQDPEATLHEPAGLALGGDVLWIADPADNRLAAFSAVSTLSSGAAISFVVGQDNSGLTGPEGNPNEDDLNLPRGVVAIVDRIVVLDADDHRGMIYTPLPSANNPLADFTLGQDDPSAGNNNPNSGGLDADALSTPWGATEAGTNVYVADSGNHRVLRYPSALLGTNRPAADLVLGQAVFTVGAANRGGVVAANTLNDPAGVAFDGTNLWVADRGNNRVVRYTLAGIANGDPASLILSAAGGVTFVDPRGVTASAGRLVIADSGNNRVLVYEGLPDSAIAASLEPDAVLGQATATGTGSNAGGGAGGCPVSITCPTTSTRPTSQSLFRPGAVLLDADDLWVADTCNARVIRFRAVE